MTDEKAREPSEEPGPKEAGFPEASLPPIPSAPTPEAPPAPPVPSTSTGESLPGIPLAPMSPPAAEDPGHVGDAQTPHETEGSAYAYPAASAQPPPSTSSDVVADHTPFASLVLSVGGALTLGFFVVAANAAVGVVALLAVRPSWPEWLAGLVYFVFICVSYGIQLLVVWDLARRRGLQFAPAVGLNRFPFWAGIGVAAVVSVVGRLLAAAATVFIELFGINFPQPTADPTAVLGTGPVSIVLILVLLMVVAPFAEEVIFRGVIMGSLQRRWGSAWAIVGSGLLFAVVHVQPATVFAIVFVGLALGWVAMHFRSTWASIFAHSFFNGASAAAILYLRSTGRL